MNTFVNMAIKNRRNGKVGGGTPKLIQVVLCPFGGPEEWHS